MSNPIDRLQLLPKEVLLPELDTTQGKLWQIWSDQCDDLNTAIEEVRLVLDINAYDGINLDRLGTLLREARKGKDDDEYRLFLQLAIQRIWSKGDINSINELAQALGYENINILEYFGEPLLDGTLLLDGTWLLDGERTPAQFYFFRELNVDDASPNFAISEMIDSVRAAGVRANISFTFIVLESQCVVYTTFTGVLDGTWDLDGEKMLRPDKTVYTPNEIALGDGAQPGGIGAVRTPLPTDTGLQNELIRKDVITLEVGSLRIHLIELALDELVGNYINELGIFRDSSPILIDSFESKQKDALTFFNFKLEETV